MDGAGRSTAAVIAAISGSIGPGNALVASEINNEGKGLMVRSGPATRKALCTAAKQLFLTRGWEDTPALAIRKQAGVCQGSWTYAFPEGKAQIGAAIYLELFQDIWSPVLIKLRADGPGVTCIATAVEVFVGQIEAQTNAARLLFQLEETLAQTAQLNHVRTARIQITSAFEGLAARSRTKIANQVPGALLYALTFGPPETFCRGWLQGVSAERPSRQIACLRTTAAKAAESAFAAARKPKDGPSAARQSG